MLTSSSSFISSAAPNRAARGAEVRRQAVVGAPRRYQEVAAKISRYIAENRLAAGSRLPAESELGRVCGVSRSTVREAMLALEIMGELEVRTGSGAYVRAASASISLEPKPGPAELLRARITVEGEIAAAAAMYASADDLARLQRLTSEMERAVQGRHSAREIDRAFHVAVGEASKNSVLVSIVGGLWNRMFAPIHHGLMEAFVLHSQQAESLADHRAILAAIAGRNANGARQAMRRHLGRVEECLKSAARWNEVE